MKLKKLLFSLILTAGLMSTNSLLALDYGSIMRSGENLYPKRDGAAPGATVNGMSFDFKVVTVGNKTWAWTNVEGLAIAGNAWSSQLRYYPYEAARENQLKGRIPGTQQTYGMATVAPNQNPLEITFLQEENNVFYETASFTYDYTKVNDADESDKTAPTLNTPVVNSQTAFSLDLSLSASDNSGELFYYIVDEAQNFVEVSFFDNIVLSLNAGSVYNFSIYAIDFSGNISDVKTVKTEEVEVKTVSEGTAQAISFKLDSRSLTELVVDCSANEYIGDAFVKISINGSTLDNEWKPTIDQGTGAKNYQIRIPSSEIPGWAADVVISLNLGYIVMPIGDWGHYVMDNSTLTEGENAGTPIFHKIGTGVDIAEPKPMECENNLVSDASLTLGTPYFATGESWTETTNYTANFANHELTLHLGDATTLQWQAQFPLILTTPLTVTAGKKYGISVTVETNKSVPAYMKLMDGEDEVYMEIARTTVAESGKKIGAYNITCPEGLTQISKILFDFGGSSADTDLKIKDITICDKIKESGGDGLIDLKGSEISISQQNDKITIHAENEIKSTLLYSVCGQTTPVRLLDNKIDTTNLSKGIYILQITTSNGKQQSFKVIIR